MTVDDRIPVSEIPRGYVGAGTKRPFNSGAGANGGWWLPILEKAYAKFNGFYANLNGGQPEQALREMSGMPSIGYRTNSQSTSDIYNIVDNADRKHWVMTAACHYQYDGLVTGHAYSMLGAVTVNGDKLLKMRNPWGREKYTGPYSDNDSRWSSSAKQQAGYTPGGDDGTFYMPVANFKRAFASYTVLMYQDWHHDSAHITGRGDRIEKPISSSVSQKMIATVNYLNPRQTAPGCNANPGIYYNLYVLSSRGQSLKQVAVSSQTAYGVLEFDL